MKLSEQWVALCARDERRRRKEAEFSERLSGVLLSDKLLDDAFCQNALPRIVDQYAAEVEKNSRAYLADLAAYEKMKNP